MWIIALEALVALGMLVLIVWLTMGSSRGSSRRGDADARDEARREHDSDARR